MKQLTLLASSALAALFLAGCVANQAVDGVVQGQERKGGLLGLATEDSIKVDTAAAFKGANKVTVGNFIVGFATLKTDSAKAGGYGVLGGGFGGKSTAKTTLKGIDEALMQRITDAAYEKFVADLKAKGYEVVDRAALVNTKGFGESKTYPNPSKDTSGIFGTNSITKYFTPKSFGALRSFMGDLPGYTGGFGFENPIHSVNEYAKASGVKVLSMVYVLDFANADSYGGLGTSSSSVNVGQGLTAIPETTKLSLIGGDGGTFSSNNGNIRLGQPITSEKEFGTIANTNSEAYKGLEMATNVIGILGGVGGNVSREYDVTARPADYQLAVEDALKLTNQALLGKMQVLK